MNDTRSLRPGWWADLIATAVATLCFLAATVFVIAVAATSPEPLGAGVVTVIALLAGLTPLVLLGALTEVESLLEERRRWLRREARR